MLTVLALNFRAYYLDFALRCRYGLDPQGRFASYLGNYLRTLDRETTAYLLSDEIFRYGTHDSVDFLSRSFPVTNIPEPVDSLSVASKTAIIAIPSRMSELEAWVAAHPGGRLQRESDCGNPMLLAYQLP
jgi:hypothetical protein